MFTGIIRQLGTVDSFRGPRLRVRARLGARGAGELGKPALGASIAVSGVCLTVVKRSAAVLDFDVSAETLRLTTLGDLEPGAPVNLEPSLRLSDFIGGHLVSGHVDARARVLEVERLPNAFTRLAVELPAPLRKLVAYKGSIAVDGVSLTVTRVSNRSFETVLIPETLSRTTLGTAKPGSRVNLEADVLARYAARAREVRG